MTTISPYRMVVADIDGTLLDSTATLRPRVRAAIERARRAGIVFTVATGRRYLTTMPVLESLAEPHGVPSLHAQDGERQTLRGVADLPPVVLQAGAMVVSADGRQILYRDPMPGEDARRAIGALVKLGLQPIVYEDQVLEQRLATGPTQFDSAGARRYFEGNRGLTLRLPYEELATGADPLQLAVIGERGPLEAAVPLLELAHCRTIISYSEGLDSYFMEVFHHTCNKGKAVAHLAGQLGLEMAQTVCIGDNWNDVEMLAMAGCGLAVANAAPGIAPYARRLAPSNDEDAVGVIIEQILAGEEPGVAKMDAKQ